MSTQHIKLSVSDQKHLEGLLSGGTLPVKVYKRSSALLSLHEGKSYSEVSRLVKNSLPTIRNLAKRYRTEGLSCLYDRPRSGRPILISQVEEDQIVILACEDPPEGHSQWSLRLLSDYAVKQEIVESISHEKVNQILKKRGLSLT